MLNNIYDYYKKYIEQNFVNLVFLDIGALGKGIYDFDNKLAIVEEGNNFVIIYRIKKNLAYEIHRKNNNSMFEMINLFIQEREKC